MVIGAGAVGAYFGGMLALGPARTSSSSRAASNLAALRARGLRIEAADGTVRVEHIRRWRPPSSRGRTMRISCSSVSSRTTPRPSPQRCGRRPPDTIVLSLQNGIENETLLAAALGLPPLLGGLTHIGAELVAPGVVRHDSGGRIIFGEFDGRRSPRAERLAALFTATHIAHHLSGHVAVMLWDKLAWNAAFNACTAVARRTVGELLAQPDGRALVGAAMREVVAVATANGVPLDPARVGPRSRAAHTELGHLRTSMLQDRERGRRLEHEALNGAVVRAAARTDVPVPINRVLYALLAVLDRRRPQPPPVPPPP